MEQRLLVNIQRQDWTLEFETHALTASFTIGGPEAEIFVPGCRKQTLLTCTLLPEGYEISLQGACLADMEETTLRFAERSSADLCVQAGDQMLFRLRATPVAPPPVPVYDRQADVPEGRAILIGGADSDDICIASPLFSSSVLRAAYAGGRWLLEPLAPAPLGMYRNVERLTHSCQADIGDFVQVGPLSICLKEKQLLLPSDGTAQVRTLHYTDHAEQMSHLRYPCVNRTSRQLLKKPTDDIPILDPPAAIEEKKNNLVISLLPTAAMIALTVLLRNSFSSNSSMIVFSALSMSIGAVSSVLTYVQISREGKKAQRKRDKNYREYIGQCEERIQQAHAHERQALRQIYPDFQTELQAVRDFSAQLFDRRQQDEDFWDIRLGEGALRSAQKITCARHEVFESTDLLFDLPGHLQQKYALVDGLPAVVRGAQAGAVGILGDDEQLRAAVRLMTLDLAVRQYFDDMRLFYFLPPVFQPEMEAVRLLPHVKNPSIPRRSIAHDEESRATLTESLYKLLSDREAEPDALAGQPWITVFIFADDSPIMQHP